MIDFPAEMYNSPVGSYVITATILNGNTDKKEIGRLIQRWHYLKRSKKKLDIFDLKAIAKKFNVPYTI